MHVIDSLITWFWPVWLMFKFPAISLYLLIHSINSSSLTRILRVFSDEDDAGFMAWMWSAGFCSNKVSWAVSRPLTRNVGSSTCMVQVFCRNNGPQSAWTSSTWVERWRSLRSANSIDCGPYALRSHHIAFFLVSRQIRQENQSIDQDTCSARHPFSCDDWLWSRVFFQAGSTRSSSKMV